MNNKGGSLFSKIAGNGILGILIFILLLPIFLLIAIFGGIYLLYIRWKMKRAMKKMTQQFQNMGMGDGGMPAGNNPNDLFASLFAQMGAAQQGDLPNNEEELTADGRKKVKVTTIKQEPGKIDEE